MCSRSSRHSLVRYSHWCANGDVSASAAGGASISLLGGKESRRGARGLARAGKPSPATSGDLKQIQFTAPGITKWSVKNHNRRAITLSSPFLLRQESSPSVLFPGSVRVCPGGCRQRRRGVSWHCWLHGNSKRDVTRLCACLPNMCKQRTRRNHSPFPIKSWKPAVIDHTLAGNPLPRPGPGGLGNR